MALSDWLREQLTHAEPDACQLWPFAKKGRLQYGCVQYNGRNEVVHRVVWHMLTGSMPQSPLEMRHLCGVPACFNYHHLAVGTHAENEADKYRHGTHKRGERNPLAKLTDEKVRIIMASNLSDDDLASRFGVAAKTVCAVREGRAWLHLPEVVAGADPYRRQRARIIATEDETGYSVRVVSST